MGALNQTGNPEVFWSMPDQLVQLAQESGAEFVTEVFAIFQEDSASRLGALRTAIQNEETEGIRAEAHSLKSSSAQVGAWAMAQACREMERLAQAGSKSDHLVLLGEIETGFARLQQILSTADLYGMLSDGRPSDDRH